MNEPTPLIQLGEDFFESLKHEFKLYSESRRATTWTAWKAAQTRHPLLHCLHKWCSEATPPQTVLFTHGLQLGFGACVDLAEREAAKGRPSLKQALRRLDKLQFEADLPALKRVTMRNLVVWRVKYAPFLIGFKIAGFYRRAAEKREVVDLPVYHGVYAMTAWVAMALGRLAAADAEKAEKALPH